MADTDAQIHFDTRAVLRKWTSLNKERISKSWGATPYIIADRDERPRARRLRGARRRERGNRLEPDRPRGRGDVETTPVIFPYVPFDVRQICREQLGCDEILLVPVLPSADANPTNFVENIAREILSEGGRPFFGWRIRTNPMFVVAEFYAMHQTETGLVDVTPNTRGEHYVVFAPDHDVPADFDYLDRPVTRRFRTYVPPTRQERVAVNKRPRFLAIFESAPEVRALCSAGITRPQRSYDPVRLPP